MQMLWQRFIAALSPGVRVMVVLLTGVYLLAVAGGLTHAFNLYHWLAASGVAFWHGQIWRLVTYVLLPMGLTDFVTNVFALILLGSMLERHWTRGELWLFCAAVAAGAGLVAVSLGSVPMTGAAPMVFGLLVAWAFVCGHETVLLPWLGQVTVRKLALSLAAGSVLLMCFSAGLVSALLLVSGGLVGWLYLWLRHKWVMTRSSRVVPSERINRLEL